MCVYVDADACVMGAFFEKKERKGLQTRASQCKAVWSFGKRWGALQVTSAGHLVDHLIPDQCLDLRERDGVLSGKLPMR